MNYRIKNKGDFKYLMSENLNYVFNRQTGYSAVWGATKDEDPDFSPFGPFIADIEVTTICKGPGDKLCPFCYKANSPNGDYMSFDLFKKVFDKLPDTLQQVAYGADAQCESNPDIWKIMEYTRSKGVIPNITVADISDDTADKLVSVVGAVAVSRYADKNYCYNSIKKLVDRGLKQCNMHIMISIETLPQVWETLNDIVMGESRLEGLNAIVFLSLKKKGRGVGHNPITQEEFTRITNFCLENKISFGFDSCSAPKLLKAVEGHKDEEWFNVVAEPCESTRFSVYIDVNGDMFPCSFCEKIDGWERGISVDKCQDFINDVWMDEKTVDFRDKCISCMNMKKACQVYEV
jgi:hypothetical protein